MPRERQGTRVAPRLNQEDGEEDVRVRGRANRAAVRSDEQTARVPVHHGWEHRRDAGEGRLTGVQQDGRTLGMTPLFAGGATRVDAPLRVGLVDVDLCTAGHPGARRRAPAFAQACAGADHGDGE